MVDPALFSSKVSEWGTPDKLFQPLDEEFRFTLDVCANAANAKHPNYYSLDEKGQDALRLPWVGVWWCNPPYGRGVGAWVEWGVVQSMDQRSMGVMLLPVRTDTKWWHEWVLPYASEIRFIRGRVTFEGAENPAPFPSVLVVFGGVRYQVVRGYVI